MTPSGSVGGVWGEAFQVERRGIDPLSGLAGAAASCAPLALGIAAGEPEIGVVACFGGLNAALAVPRGVLRKRLGWGFGATLACSLSVALATAVQGSVAASVAVAFTWIGLAAILRTFGPSGGLTAFVTGAIFVIANGIPAESLDVGTRVVWFLLGSLAGVVLMAAAYTRNAPPPRPVATPLATALVRGARALRHAIVADALLRAHALRLASTVAATTLLYQLLELQHGYWVPLTVLFVLRPSYGETLERIAMRAAGTVLGLLIATPLAELIGGADLLEALAIVLAAALSYSLLAIEYALFTAAITAFAVIYAHAFGQPALAAADERAVATAIGLVICALAFAVFHDRPEQRDPAPA